VIECAKAGQWVSTTKAQIDKSDLHQNMRKNTGPEKKTLVARQSSAKWCLFAITLLAIVIRVWGIGFGLPYLYHPDEPVGVRIAQRMFKVGDLNPHFFHWPSLIFYLNALAYAPYYLIGKLIGIFNSPADIPSPIVLAMGVGYTPMPTTWLLGRALTVAFGSASVILIYLVGRDLFNDLGVGLLAAAMLTIAPTPVINSRYVAPDTFATFFVLLSLLGAVKVFRQGKPWHYILAGLGLGCTMSSKYNGAIVVLTLVIAHFLRCGLRGWKERRLYLAFTASLLSFLITTPFAVLDYEKFLTDLQFDIHHYSTGHAGMEGQALSWYLDYAWKTEGPVVLLAAGEILRGFISRSKRLILLSVFPLTYFLLISSAVVRNDRTLLLLLPSLFLLASSLLVSLFGLVRTPRFSHRVVVFIITACAVMVLVWPALQTTRQTIRLTTVDSRQTARVWIEENLPTDSRIAIESYTPYVDPNRFAVQGVNAMIDHEPEWYVTNGFEYLIFGESMFGRFYYEPIKYSAETAQYEELFHTFDMIQVFTDGGYEVRIYHIAE
jgi:4-amino-4-deoxy-L-arabinose transferase-like glycosyltransferase